MAEAEALDRYERQRRRAQPVPLSVMILLYAILICLLIAGYVIWRTWF